MRTIIGREREKATLRALWESPDPEFLAIYGRRRVGKTHLIQEFFRSRGPGATCQPRAAKEKKVLK
ncbi:MAG: ATP-binding protein [Proteobacteria bacterium]|nr:ATP-binding protein [Pseudomonadota bacterium]